MNTVYVIFSCLLAAKAVLSVQQNRAALVLDLYNEKLNYFDSFLSPSGIDGLLLSAENIPFETVKALRNAWIPYTSLYGEIISWCTEVNNTIRSSNLLQSGDRFASKVIDQLNDMKGYFDSIATNGAQGKNVEDFQAVITFAGGVRKFEVINGHTPNNIEELLWPLMEKSKTEGNVTERFTLTTLHDKVNHAKSIITEALGDLNSARNNIFNREDIVKKCKPILDKLTTSRTSSPQYTLPPETITPSANDILRVNPRSCGLVPLFRKSECEAVLSKATMERLLKLYRIDQSVADFFKAINRSGSSECTDRMISFIRNSYILWAYEVPNMEITQSLKIDICLHPDIPVALTIVN